MLRFGGHEVVEADDGWAAWHLALRDSFDVVITDSQLPGLTGPELIARLRRRDPSVRIIRMSGSSPDEKPPADVPSDIPTLFKPFQQEQLLDEVERLGAAGPHQSGV
jgi:CheY-like chemotaxis protein